MNCIVAQSGGPTVAINASLAGVISGAIKNGAYEKIYGSIHGIQGVLREQFLELSESTDEFIEKLKNTPAMYLGSCRFKLPDFREDEAPYRHIFDIFEKYNIGAFFYIGGNDSMDTVDKLSAYAAITDSNIRIIGIPKTIDNDLVLTDHTPGFGSAAKYVAASIREIAYDTYIYDLESVNIVEIMGRDAGWLTAASVLARNEFSCAPHMIYLPEVAFDKEQFITELKEMVRLHKNVIIAISEGIHYADGTYVSSTSASADKFGHAQLSGAGKALEYMVKEELGIKVRSVEINVLQRCAAHLASKTDIQESFESGIHAVSLASSGSTGCMVTLERISNTPYQYKLGSAPVCEIANKAKDVPLEWICDNKHDVTEKMIEYIKPLVEGELTTTFKGGIPEYLPVPHLVSEKQ